MISKRCVSATICAAIGLTTAIPLAAQLRSATQTSITSVYCGRSLCSDPIRLTAGQSMSISLRGSGLSSLVGGSVVSGRLATTDVTVTLGTTSLTGTSRAATLTTAASASSADGLGLRFTLRSGGGVTAPVGVSIAAQLTAPTRSTLTTLTTTDPTTTAEASVSSVTPQSVDVEPGSSATVTIQGSGLDRLTTARVLRNGTVVSNLTAEMVSGGTATSREVRLTAPAGASGPTNVPLDLQLSGQTAGTHMAPAQLYVAVPDLVVRNLRPAVAGGDNTWILGLDEIRYTYDLRNEGRADARFPVGSTTQIMNWDPFQAHVQNYEWVYDIEAGLGPTQQVGYVRVPFQTTGETPGTYTWTLEIDPMNVIPESNENNNRVTVQVTLEAEEPDLALTDLSVQPANPTDTDDIYIHATIENLGNSPASARTESPDCNVFSSVWYGGASGPLQSGERRVLVIRTDGGALFMPGTHTCSFVVQTEEPDVDRSNNQAQITYTVTGSTPVPPDLVITAGRTDAATPKANTEYGILLSVQNQGDGAHFWNAPEIRVRSTDCLVDPVGLGATYSFGFSTGELIVRDPAPEITLSPMESAEFLLKATPSLMLPAGTRSCTFVVETDGPESNTTNNMFRYTWNVVP